MQSKFIRWYSIAFIILIGNTPAFTQNRNNAWMIGYNYTQQYPDIGISFQSGSFNTFSVYRNMQFFLTDASICDTSGNLQFYTNGIYIANKNHDTLMNTQNFNSGWATDYYGDIGLGIAQGAIVIPIPDKGDRYIVFYETAEPILYNFGYTYSPIELNYSIVDMSLDGGLGGIDLSYKEKVILADTLTRGRLTACKHANGRDWWLVSHKYISDIYYKFLITPDTILGPYTQQIGIVTSNYDGLGSARFSPDGSKYVWMENRDTLNFFDFDRCTGELSNPVMTITPAGDYITTGSAISSNSTYFYVGSLFGVFQYDLLAVDIPNSVVQVAQYDTTQLGLWFSQMQLAPDGKIYIATYNGSKYLHVINEPDSFGLACNVVQSQEMMPSWNISSMPNFPNYDLGPLQGSPCDTLYMGTNFQNENLQSFTISPNPASNFFNIVYKTDHEIIATITNEIGHELQRFTLYPWFKNRIVYTDKLAPGIYLLTFTGNDFRESKKLIIQH